MNTEDLNKKLIEKFGEEKASNIIKGIERNNEANRLAAIAEHEHLQRMINVMIPKDKLVDGTHYVGHRWRGTHVAMWDDKEQIFKAINFTMGNFFLENLEYFEDVKDTRLDGFIPFEVINKVEIK